MKKLVLIFSLSMLFFTGIAQTCVTQVITYSGPTNTSQLATKLNNSSIEVIANLSSGTKTSIINNMIFKDGRPKGFTTADENIQALYSSNFAAVMSAILGITVSVTDYDNRPSVGTMTLTEFNTLYNSDPITYSPVTIGNWCSNCNAPDSNVYRCCEVVTEPRGCIDYIIKVNNVYYYIYGN